MLARSWYLDEYTHAGDEHLEAEYVDTYDHKANVDPAEDLALLGRLGLDTSKTLVDLGAGTGTLAVAAALVCRFVIAVDVSPIMLARARAKAAQQTLANITFVQGGILSYLHQGAPIDFVYSRNALHHLSDFWKALALIRIAAMLQPGVYLSSAMWSSRASRMRSLRWLMRGLIVLLLPLTRDGHGGNWKSI